MAHSFPVPQDLPVPEDDGACKHLRGLAAPSLALPSTSGSDVDLSTQSGLTVVFIYPRTAAPGETVLESWNLIPGARGCTPQACSFRDNADALLEGGVSNVFGMSTQDTAYQTEVKTRLHLPYQLLSDEKLRFCEAAKIPTFEWQGKKVTKRVTLAILDGRIVKVFYPVFPPDKSADAVVNWLQTEFAGRQSLSTSSENKMLRNLQHKTSPH